MEGFFIIGQYSTPFRKNEGTSSHWRYDEYEDALKAALDRVRRENTSFVIYKAYEVVRPVKAPVEVETLKYEDADGSKS